MPFQTVDIMDLRLKMAKQHFEMGCSKAELARRFNLSLPSVRKWLARYQAEGPSGLCDQSRRPHSHPNEIDPKIVQHILRIKAAYSEWGAPKILDRMRREQFSHPQRYRGYSIPSESSVGNILRRHGLTLPPKRAGRATPVAAQDLREADTPNAIWTTDFKGTFLLGDRRKCLPLTIADFHSRYLLCTQGLSAIHTPQVRPFFEHCFERYGLPETIRSDNGTPFATRASLAGLSALAVWWIKLGIHPERISLGVPQQNGRHERMHRTLKAEAINPPRSSFQAQQQAFEEFRRYYNEDRPHEGLGMKTPDECFERSPRRYDRSMSHQLATYPATWAVGKVNANGQLRYEGRKIFLAKCLAGEHIGIRWILKDDRECWELYFFNYLLGSYEVDNDEFRAVSRLTPGADRGERRMFS